MNKYIDADRLKAEIEKRMSENCELAEKAGEAFGHRAVEDNDILALIDSLQQEQPVEGLDVTDFCKPIDPGIAQCVADHWWEMIGEESTNKKSVEGLEEELEKMWLEWCEDDIDYLTYASIARHFAEWGARHSINWGDVQLLDTFILELSREEKDGTDWGDSEKFYTEVLRRFHEFNDKKISEIVAEWGAEHLKR